MKKYTKNLILALVCFLIVLCLNFFLPRLLPGNPIAYLTGFSEEDMTSVHKDFPKKFLILSHRKLVGTVMPPRSGCSQASDLLTSDHF